MYVVIAMVTCIGLSLVPYGSFDGHVEERVDHGVPEDRRVILVSQAVVHYWRSLKFFLTHIEGIWRRPRLYGGAPPIRINETCSSYDVEINMLKY